jgi:shikimate dehydrogenase
MKRACVIGWPVSHSLSPAIHGYWLRENGIDGAYTRAAVEPTELAHFLATLSAQGFCGANVTAPHKIEAYRLCDARDSAAEAIGAVNTLWLDRGRLIGSNTDAVGFVANLDEAASGWRRNGSAVIIGAGGAARAIVWALMQQGFGDVRIVNRSKARAEALAAAFPPAVTFDIASLPAALEGASLLVNASILGMAGASSLEIDLAPLASGATVFDAVYHPLETRLLRQAREKGFAAVDGLGMLLHQAIPGFEHWFGLRPEVTHELRAAVLHAVAARESAAA